MPDSRQIKTQKKGQFLAPFHQHCLTIYNEQFCFSPNNFHFFVMCSICRFPKVWSFLRSRCPDDPNRKYQTFSPHSAAEYNRTRERIAAAAKHFYCPRRAPFFSHSFSESELIARHSGY